MEIDATDMITTLRRTVTLQHRAAALLRRRRELDERVYRSMAGIEG